ncbi:MAG: ChbG/HpnK family deacetylase [Clostridiales bacterium]|nr:ChbG/HpnK family deacetylase [Clostridiales bacterium]
MYRLVIRTDDVGYTDVYNIGTFETYANGYSTSADIMLESPGTVDALKRLKEMPWVSVGWHTHFWNSPVLDAKEVPSLVIPGTDRFRHDVKTAEDVNFEEALAEMRTELNRCVEILGRAPDVGGVSEGNTPFTRAMAQVTKEYGMVCDYGHKMHLQPDGTFQNDPVAPQWEKAGLYIIDQRGIVAGDIMVETFKEQWDYDPVKFLLEDRMRLHDLPEGSAIMHGFHPGYLDYYVAKLGDYGPNTRYYTVSRTYDVEGLCSRRLHDWIKENQIELCNLRDVLYGTQEYQNHLRHIGSDLCVL